MTNELTHHGIKGQKWGIRRFQNKDGSLTDAGKKRKANSGDYTARILRGHAGPGRYIGDKSKLAGYKKDLEILDNGGHLSVGLTKKRQEMYDKRDRAELEKRIGQLEAKKAAKDARKAVKKESISDNKQKKKNIINTYKIGAGLSAASMVLEAAGRIQYNKYKYGSTPARTLAINGMGYASKALLAMGGIAVTTATAASITYAVDNLKKK